MSKPSVDEENNKLLEDGGEDLDVDAESEEFETGSDGSDDVGVTDNEDTAAEGPSRENADAGRKSGGEHRESARAEASPIKVIRRQLKAEQARRKELESYIDALAALGGVDRGTLLQQVKAMLMQSQQVQPTQPAVQQGQQFRQDPRLSVVARQSRQALLELEAEKLSRKPFYQDLADDTIRESVIDYALTNDVDVKTSYLLLYGEDVAERYSEITAKAQAAERMTKLSLRAERDTAGHSLSKEELDELEIARKAGIDPATFRSWDFDSYRQYLKSKKKRRR